MNSTSSKDVSGRCIAEKCRHILIHFNPYDFSKGFVAFIILSLFLLFFVTSSVFHVNIYVNIYNHWLQ